MCTLNIIRTQEYYPAMPELNESYIDLIGKTSALFPKTPTQFQTEAALRLRAACADARKLFGKMILDIGCGSEQTLDGETFVIRAWRLFRKNYHFQPHYARMAFAGSAYITGIDAAPNMGEPFHDVQLDLTKKDALATFKDETFDIINNANFTAPLDHPSGVYAFSPSFSQRVGYVRTFEISEHIHQEVIRLLNPGGMYTFREKLYRKERGGLELLNENLYA